MGLNDNALIWIMNEVNELLTLSKERATAKDINCSLATTINGDRFLAVITGKQDSDSHLVLMSSLVPRFPPSFPSSFRLMFFTFLFLYFFDVNLKIDVNLSYS